MKKRVTFSLDEDLIKNLKSTSKRTMIPQARLVERAVKELLLKYRH